VQRKGKLDLVLLIGALVLVVVLTVLRQSLPSSPPSVPSTYDTGRSGYAALYALLQREHVRTTRFEEPPAALFRRHGALVIAGDGAIATATGMRQQAKALDEWVRGGGTLVLLGSPPTNAREALALPKLHDLKATSATGACGLSSSLRGISVSGDFRAGAPVVCRADRAALLTANGRAVATAYRRGKGTVILVVSSTPLDNTHLAQRNNAAVAYALFAGIGPVAFNERVYGHATGRTFWQVLPLSMKIAIILAGIAVLLAAIGANLPFVPPYAPPDAGGRDSSEYIASLARLLDRGGAGRETIARLCTAAGESLKPRAAADAHARALLDEAQRLQTLSHPRPDDVLAAGQLFARVRKDYP
jgi:hypothetical protein